MKRSCCDVSMLVAAVAACTHVWSLGCLESFFRFGKSQIKRSEDEQKFKKKSLMNLLDYLICYLSVIWINSVDHLGLFVVLDERRVRKPLVFENQPKL